MQPNELNELVRQIINDKHESNNIELKSAENGCPKKLYDTLSSFSNQDEGGIIIFGIDEKKDYSLVGVYDAQDLQTQINNQCKSMEPIVRPLITISKIDSKFILSAEIPGIEISERPCYYKGKGRITGSYIRCGDADEQMTDYEIYSYEAYRKKYQDDVRTVEGASFDIINTALFEKYKANCKNDKPHISNVTDEQFNELMSITKNKKLTISSIMMFGIYPQAFFPQLSIVATAIYGTEMGELGKNGERFIDNKRIEGPITDMIDSAIKFVRNNMRLRTVINPQTGKRTDSFEYPMTAVREVIVNAIVHRDYSMHTEGMPIQITIYSNRLEVKNPGGLYGRLKLDQLGKVQPDTRNPVLATMMETMKLTENRYSGIPTIRSEMEKSGLPAPLFEDRRGNFCVTLYNNREYAECPDKSKNGILEFCSVPRTRNEIAAYVGVSTVSYAIQKYIKPLIESGEIDITNKEKPNSPDQTYYTKADS